MSALLDRLESEVLLLDGAMGSQLQAIDFDIQKDFLGCENCMELLNQTRPDLIRAIHEAALEAGADGIQTNSFGASPVTLGEFGRADEAFALSRRAGELAREAIEHFAGDRHARFVLGSIGPGTRLPSLGHIDYDTAEAAFAVQAEGLLAGGVDAMIIETVQDLLQAKAAINGARLAFAKAGRTVPIIVQVTVETTGALLVGSEIAAAATVLEALKVPVMGLNCATGPQEMAEHVRWLSRNWPGPVAVQPNAGLPELVDGHPHYALGPEEMAKWLERFVEEDGVALVGGCCGTTATHIAALDHMLRARAGGARRPRLSRKTVAWPPSVASLYTQVGLRQENAILMIGERCNANGSRKFREFQAAENWDACLATAREQQQEGSHCLDICTAYVGRDEVKDMTAFLTPLRGAVATPLVIDSTELNVLEAALKLYGGKAIVNSINFEDGEAPAAARMRLARKFGAAVVALTIDEPGMAKDAAGKLRIAQRLHDFACTRHGLSPGDLLIDPLTFTICTGNDDDRRLGIETLDGIELIRAALPDCQILLGLSNISFGLKPQARHVLNSVFLDYAVRRGMTAAIVHASKIVPLHKIPAAEAEAAEDLIFDRRRPGHDPLHAFIALFEGRDGEVAAKRPRPANVEERLSQRIVDGDRQGLQEELDEALKSHPPLDIINRFLLDGMKVVGELFGSGRMQLPFVLQSAETMKAAVAYLEPFMDRVAGQAKGTIVLATVKGDVHDIGKNLADIILTNNGYRVINLGIKQPLAAILAAAREHAADAVGMSGLLVKSTVIMRENLIEMTRERIGLPVLLGGAALTRRFVEDDCAAAYGSGRVVYARDAFDGLTLMDRVMSGDLKCAAAAAAAHPAERARAEVAPVESAYALAANGGFATLAANGGFATSAASGEVAASAELPPARAEASTNGRAAPLRPVDSRQIRMRRDQLAHGVPVPKPPFWREHVIQAVPPRAILPYLNTTMLYQFHWGYRKQGRRIDTFRAWAKRELTPVLERMLVLCEAEEILRPSAVYGYWPAAADGDSIVLFEPGGGAEVARFRMPRQPRPGGLCIADFLRDISAGERDVIGLQVVTVGQRASEVARAWFAADRYRDYLYLHGLGVEMAEAMAEYTHGRIRSELGFGHEDARDMNKLLKQNYRGARYSFGYPACPNLHDQHKLLELLGAERIGVSMGEEDQLHPEQSTSAIVIHHPQARYFAM